MPTTTKPRRRTRGSGSSTSEPPPLRSSLGGTACKWMEEKLVHGEGDRYGRPLELLDWHREFLWRWFEQDPSGAQPWWYIEALIGAERGASKTELLAALAHLEMAGPKGLRRESTPLVQIGAAAYEQAGEMFRQCQIMAGGAKGQELESAPLFGLYNVFDQEIEFASGRPGRISRVAAVAGTNEGGKASLVLGDELAEWTGRKARVWTVLTASLTKRTPFGRSVGISMAGAGKGAMPPKDTDPLLWRLYSRGVLEADNPDSRFLMMWRTAAEHWDLDDPEQCEAALREMWAADVTWDVAHRRDEILSRKIPRHEARRLYLCQWADMPADSWLTELPGCWEGCGEHAAENIPPDGAEVVVGVDMALHHDSVGVVVAGQLSDGRVGWWPRVWEPVDGRIDHADVFATIAGVIAQRWQIQRIVYDPRFFELPANMLADQGFTVVEFPQSPERLVPADGLLYELVRTGQLGHPDDPVLNHHASNAAWREGERGRFLSKSKAGGHMDLVRAGSMATYELLFDEEDDVDLASQVW